MKIQNLNIKGGNQQFADKIINNQGALRKEEKELLELVKSTSIDDKTKVKLLESFSVVRNEDQPTEVRKKAGSVLKNFLESGAKQAGKQLIQEIIKGGMEYAQFLT